MDNQVSIKLEIYVEGKWATYLRQFTGRLLGDGNHFTVYPNQDDVSMGSGATSGDAIKDFISANIPEL